MTHKQMYLLKLYTEGYEAGRLAGAAEAFGLLGMAEAIRNRCTCPDWGTRGFMDWADVCQRCKGYP